MNTTFPSAGLRWQFSLRTVLRAVVLISVLLAGVRWWYVRVYLQGWAARELTALGVTIDYSDSYVPTTKGGPGWGGGLETPENDFLRGVVGVSIPLPLRSDEDAEKVNRLLHCLPCLVDVKGRDADYGWNLSDVKQRRDAHFATALRGLSVSGVVIQATLQGGQTAKYVGRSAAIRTVCFLFGPEVSVEDLEVMIQSPYLVDLICANTDFGPEHIAVLGKAKHPKKIKLDRCPPENLEGLGALPACELHLYSEKFTDADLHTVVSKLPNLRKLGLFRANVTDEGVAALRQTVSLDSVSLQNTEVGDGGLLALAELPNLTFINLGATNVTVEGLARFLRKRQVEDVVVSDTLDVAVIRKEFPEVRIHQYPIQEYPKTPALNRKRLTQENDGSS